MCADFITRELVKIGTRFARLLMLVIKISAEDPRISLRLLQVSGVHGFGYILATHPAVVMLMVMIMDGYLARGILGS
jgi:hypothetical protein